MNRVKHDIGALERHKAHYGKYLHRRLKLPRISPVEDLIGERAVDHCSSQRSRGGAAVLRVEVSSLGKHELRTTYRPNAH